MNGKKLDFILQEGEGQYIEFKESFDNKNFAKEIVAFANASGGKIFLGVDDKCKIKRIKITNKLRSQIQDLAKNCDPSIFVSFEESSGVLIIEIKEGNNKPYSCSSGFFMRIGPNSQKLKRDEIIELSIGEGKIKFDSQLNEAFNFENDFDELKLDEYLNLINVGKKLSKEDILLNLGVAKRRNEELIFNNAGVLFFSKDSSKFLKTSKVICVNYQTNEKLKILDKKVFDGGIINNIQDSINYVQKHIDVEYVINKLKRDEVVQYPLEAIREVIVNSIMHRDYFDDSEDILVEIFKNKLVVSNPGGLVLGLDEKDFGKKSRTRNSLIANLLLRTDYVEKLGTGINRIKSVFSRAGLLEPLFRYDSSFLVELYDKTEKVGEKVGENLTENQKLILNFIEKNKFVSIIKLSEKVGIATKNIESNLLKLKEKKLLERVGAARGGHWKINFRLESIKLRSKNE